MCVNTYFQILRIERDIQLRFLKKTNTPGVYTWSTDKDVSWQSPEDILRKLSAPILLPGRGLQMKFNMDELKFAENVVQQKV